MPSICAVAASRTASATTSTSFADYVSDVAGAIKIAKSREPGLPVFLLGHSAGGVVACIYTLDEPGRARRTDLRELRLPGSGSRLSPSPVFKGLSHIAPHAHVLHLKNEDFSRDPKRVAELNDDPLIAHETQPTKTVGRDWCAPTSG